MLTEPTDISIDVFPDPLAVPTPSGFQAEGTLFVNIELTPQPAYPLPAPGLTVVLPLPSARIPGSSLHLFRVNPATATLEPAIGVDGNPVIGTVNGPEGLSATFTGIARLSTVIALAPNEILVAIDIMPGSDRNPINVRSRGGAGGGPGQRVLRCPDPGSDQDLVRPGPRPSGGPAAAAAR
ncbi:MAG: hypothetical protein IPM24_28475 [Bryobacterales bacterium]|nr:hypothetical protein [Bryobacterales bacterium]